MWNLIKMVFCFIMRMIKWVGGISFWTTSIAFITVIFALTVFYCMDPEMTKYCLQTTQEKEKRMTFYFLRWALLFWTSGGILLFLLKSF